MSGQFFGTNGSPSSSLPLSVAPYQPPAQGGASAGYPFGGDGLGRQRLDGVQAPSEAIQMTPVQTLPEAWSYLQQVPPANQGGAPLSERDLKTLKRKQANRDAARRSKVRRKVEAQALGMRLKELMAENDDLKTEVAESRREVSKLAKLNSSHRAVLTSRGVALDGYPPVDTHFEAPKEQEGENKDEQSKTPCASGSDATATIPEVLEFSRDYGAQFGLPTARLKSGELSPDCPQSSWKELGIDAGDAEKLEDHGASSASTDRGGQ
ncbi:unnamed protein product [Ostreobium quekettii]|uniref:BZIP domain-containing protein n=1 Tax=Ostreobium quekettii TaxID=121088 RepID=A0A8S1IP02_9CHLO|nr:unnamed protein product [Ostreobium quekettii]|eukprot:evm.model.scf_48.5 EVM.evm.TU.scf_48.5   scf_48:24246-26449(-)